MGVGRHLRLPPQPGVRDVDYDGRRVRVRANRGPVLLYGEVAPPRAYGFSGSAGGFPMLVLSDPMCSFCLERLLLARDPPLTRALA
eukprot:1193355-Prorocentrum_minimum.AAC.3